MSFLTIVIGGYSRDIALIPLRAPRSDFVPRAMTHRPIFDEEDAIARVNAMLDRIGVINDLQRAILHSQTKREKELREQKEDETQRQLEQARATAKGGRPSCFVRQ